MVTSIFEGFSVSHAAILDGVTAADAFVADEFSDIYGVSNASLSADTGNFDNQGDDSIQSSWYWLNYGSLTVEAGYIPFKLMASLTGSTLGSSGSGNSIQYSLPLWEEDSLNIAPKPVLIRIPSKDSNGVVRTLDFVLYKVQFSPISFNGPAYKQGLRLNYSGRALISSLDETGASLAKRAVGRIVSTA